MDHCNNNNKLKLKKKKNRDHTPYLQDENLRSAANPASDSASQQRSRWRGHPSCRRITVGSRPISHFPSGPVLVSACLVPKIFSCLTNLLSALHRRRYCTGREEHKRARALPCRAGLLMVKAGQGTGACSEIHPFHPPPPFQAEPSLHVTTGASLQHATSCLNPSLG